ncbi:MAG: hypothetical protein AAGI53_16135 [Planctomycetota bacterium]
MRQHSETRGDLAATEVLEKSVQRLASEWREAKQALGLPLGSSWSQIANRLDVDRGTSQRLARMASMDQFKPADLDYIPGTAAWQKVLSGMELHLGADHRAYARLSLACDRFDQALTPFGGSKAGAKRALESAEAEGMPTPVSWRRARSKKAWIDAAAEYVGFRVAQKNEFTFVRRSPGRDDTVDVAMAVVFLGCTGEPWALPFTLARYASKDGNNPLTTEIAPRFALLTSVTTSPPPAVLSTGDGDRQTVFIEPSWTDVHSSLDIGIMLTIEETIPLPWLEDPKQLILTSLMRQPSNSYRNECYLDASLDAATYVTAYSAYRDLSVLGLTRHWFDRLPEAPPIEQVGAFARRDPGSQPFARFNEFVDEVRRRLDWDLDSFAGYGVTVEAPIPFARYSMEFECHEPIPDPSADA